MGWKDKMKDLAQKGQELKTEYDRRQAQRAPGAAPILQVTSHDEGRNATVTLYPDRIERVKEKAFRALSSARQDTEIIPIRAISSVQAKKHGLRTNVTVFASGNTIDFRIAHQEAQRFKEAIMQLVLAGPPSMSSSPPAAPPALDVADQIRRLGELRDQGLLTDEEFVAKKKQILGL